MTTSKTFRATSNGPYFGNTDPAFMDTLILSAGVAVQASNFEQLRFAGNNDVTLMAGPDFGLLQIKGAETGDNHLHIGVASIIAAYIEGKNGVPPDVDDLLITGVAGSTIQINRPAPVAAQFTTDGTINVSGNVLHAKVAIDDIAGDAALTLSGGVDYVIKDVAEYRVAANGNILVTDNGHTISLDWASGQSWHVTDSDGDVYGYVELVGLISAAADAVLIA